MLVIGECSLTENVYIGILNCKLYGISYKKKNDWKRVCLANDYEILNEFSLEEFYEYYMESKPFMYIELDALDYLLSKLKTAEACKNDCAVEA